MSRAPAGSSAAAALLAGALALAALAGGCKRHPAPPKVHRIDALPSDLARPVADADAAIQALQQRLATRLMEELERAGPQAAVGACRDEAQSLTAAVAKDRAVAVGRTSHRLRNPDNAPRPWARPHVEAAAGKRAGEAAALAIDLGDRVGVLRPIPTGGACTTCHGPPGAIAPDLLRALRAAYPDDRATGFSEGDLRGFFWAEARK